MSGPGRLLVVAPHATRTGSTRVLLDLLRAAAPDLGCDLAVHLEAGGALGPELQGLGPRLRPGERPAAVLVNSVLAASVLVEEPWGVPSAVYLHESAQTLAIVSEAARAGLAAADVVVCVSEHGREAAIGVGVTPSRIVLLPPVVAEPAPPAPDSVAAVRRQLGLAPGDRLVLGCGEVEPRKGADLFVALAGACAAEPGLHLAWIGRRLPPYAERFDHDVAALGLRSRVTWVGEVADASCWFAAAAVVVMPSRSDPLPLVPLEAALVGAPTAAFAVDGLRTLGDAGAVAVAPFPDVPALAAEVRRLAASPEAGRPLVAAAAAWARDRQSPTVVVPRFLEILRSLLEPARTAGGPR